MNPTTMYKWPASTVYADLVKLAGGPEPLVRLALEKFEGGSRSRLCTWLISS